MKDIWLETGLGKIYGKMSGPEDGQLVLGLHGWSQRNGWHTWEPLLTPLGEAGFRAISVDMPGWGNSSALGQGQITKPEAMQVVVTILDTLGVESAILMGKSWGGGIVLNVALGVPGRVTHLILTAPAYRNFGHLPDITQPVLLAWAEDDRVIPFKYANEMASRLPNCQLETYPTGGHNAAPNNADDFAPKAITFLT